MEDISLIIQMNLATIHNGKDVANLIQDDENFAPERTEEEKFFSICVFIKR